MSNTNEAQCVNYTLLKMFIDTILPYNGDPNTLNSFLSAGDLVGTDKETTTFLTPI